MGKDDHPRYVEGRRAYEAALDDHDEDVWLTEKTCGQLVDGEVCTARGTYEEGYVGDRYRISGECSAGHLTERYGVSERIVT